MAATVTFLLGRSGAGKSRRIAQTLAADMSAGRRAVLFVPEQFTYETERTLSQALGGLVGVQVLSFTRLSERVLAPQAVDTPFLSAQGRRMVFRRAAYRRQRELSAFGPVAQRPGFAQKMDELFALCKRFLITPEDLQKAASQLPKGDVLGDKLEDLSLLFGEVQGFLSSRYLDSEDAFNALVEALPYSFLQGTQVYVDGFDLLTAQLYALFEAMMGCCGALTFSILMDPDNPEDPLFAPESRAFAKLSAMAREKGCPVMVKRLDAPEGNTPLHHLERALFQEAPAACLEETDQITVFCAATRQAEVEAMADEMLRLSRNGMRYREMAVIAGDMEAYGAGVQRAMGQRGIPVFLDARRAMEGHPAVELINAALQCICRGMPAGEVLRVGKTGLAGVTQDEMEQLENYILRYGLQGGKQLLEPFTRGEVPPEAQIARETLLAPLARLVEGFKGAQDAAGKTRALYDYLQELGVAAQLIGQVEQLKAEGRYALMQEHAQVWNVIVEVLDQLYGILGATLMSRREYAALVEEAFSGYQVGVIPSTADQVLFGGISRVKSRRVKALFLLGCNEGILPAGHGDDGVIDDLELQDMAALGLNTWGTSINRAENDRLDLYRALTKAQERLWVGYACSDGSGELLPSTLVKRINALFPHCRMGTGGAGAQGERETLPQSRESGFLALVEALREGEESGPRTQSLLRYYEKDPAYRARLAQMMDYRANPVSPPPFGPTLAAQLYGRRLVTTASRLETFNTCPFRHLMQYGLKALPRREFRQRPEDMGSFCHMAMEAFVREAANRGFEGLTQADVDGILDGVFPACLAAYREGMLVSTPRSRAMAGLWMDVVRHAAAAVVRQIQAGTFRPAGVEVRFGMNEAYPPIRLTLEGGRQALLCGVVDRVDVAPGQGDIPPMARVVDYKTGNAQLHFEQVLAGVQLQLPLYLAAVAQAGRIRRGEELSAWEGAPIPAGLFYQPVKDPPSSADTPEEVEKAFRLSGLLLCDPAAVEASEKTICGASAVMAGLRRNQDGALKGALVDAQGLKRLLQFARQRARDTLEQVMEGETAASPLAMGMAGTACAYCDYKSVCRFEPRLPGCQVRDPGKVSQEAFLQIIGCQRGEEPHESMD